jgi:hypothetical protein
MKYCVFGFHEESPKIAKAKNNLSKDPFSLATSYESYVDAVKSGKFKTIYFLVDFGWAKNISFWKAVDVNYFGKDNANPWLMIEMNKNGKSAGPMIKSMRLELKGFSEKYLIAYSAFTKFNKYIEMKIKCELYAEIFGNENKFITDSATEIRRKKNNSNFYCRKYKFEEWD